MTRFYCFLNGKIKKEPEKLELDINVAKTGSSLFFRGKQQIPQCGMKIHVHTQFLYVFV